jgi:protocatechuate 3,4-dioxygenase alpha subunit
MMTERGGKPEGVTPSATVGPYFKYGLAPGGQYPWVDTFSAKVATADAQGEAIRIGGRVLDGDGNGVPDAMVEIWQADGAGRFAHPLQNGGIANAAFKGFGRADTAGDGSYGFETVKPGRVAGPGGKLQAPHITAAVFARGMLRHLYTRIYFADEAANSEDHVLGLVPADRRETLIAKREGGVYRFDIRLQGAGETVFFDC